MDYLVDIKEELDYEIQEQIRKFRMAAKGSDNAMWYRIQYACARIKNNKIWHYNIEECIAPNFTDEEIDPIQWYHACDPQQLQVKLLNTHLKASSHYKRARGRVTHRRLKLLFEKILKARIDEYLNPKTNMEKLKILCIVGESGTGKTLASLHLKYKLDANVICSFTSRPPRDTEVEGRDHHFIDIVPDRSELIAWSYFGAHYYYAAKWQVFGPCTVYVIDEKGLDNLKTDFGDVYDIYTVYIKRDKNLRKKVGVKPSRINRDARRQPKPDEYYDYIVENNGTKKTFFREIERIYEEVKNK